MMSIPDIYKKDPYGDMLRNTIAYKNEQIKELEATLERVKKLPQKWQTERLDYPFTPEGIACKITVGLCADELESAVKGESSELEGNK